MRPICWRTSILLGTAIALVGPTCRASFTAVEVGVLADQSSLIVEGVVVRVEDSDLRVAGRGMQLAVVQVASVLKSLRVSVPREVRVIQPVTAKQSTDLIYAVGKKGVWLLDDGPREGVYIINHPSRVQPPGSGLLVRELVETRSRLPLGEAVGGLTARVELIPDRLGRLRGRGAVGMSSAYFVRLSLINVSDRDIKLDMRKAAESLRLVHEKAGTSVKSELRLLPGVLRHFQSEKSRALTLAPGAIVFVGPEGKGTGLAILTAGAGNKGATNELGPGSIAAQFSVQRDDRGGPEWSGSVSSNLVRVPN